MCIRDRYTVFSRSFDLDRPLGFERPGEKSGHFCATKCHIEVAGTCSRGPKCCSILNMVGLTNMEERFPSLSRMPLSWLSTYRSDFENFGPPKLPSPHLPPLVTKKVPPSHLTPLIINLVPLPFMTMNCVKILSTSVHLAPICWQSIGSIKPFPPILCFLNR